MSCTILVVDDHKAINEIITLYLGLMAIIGLHILIDVGNYTSSRDHLVGDQSWYAPEVGNP